jgi:hypothetical protein
MRRAYATRLASEEDRSGNVYGETRFAITDEPVALRQVEEMDVVPDLTMSYEEAVARGRRMRSLIAADLVDLDLGSSV